MHRPFLLVYFIAVCLAFGTYGAQATDVLTSRNDRDRTGANLSETMLRPSNVNAASFGKRFTFNLPGAGHIYAQPLFVSNLTIPGRGIFNVLLVATTNNKLFALDADADLPLPASTVVSGGILWQRDLGPPPSMEDVWRIGKCDADDRHCVWRGSNIEGNVGVLSTPVIDRSRNIIFLVNRIKSGTSPSDRIVYEIHAIDLLTGNDVGRRAIAGDKFGIEFRPAVHNQRPGLALTQTGQIIVAFGAHGDVMPFRGWIMSYRFANGLFAQTGIFLTTPDGKTDRNCAPSAPSGTMRGDPSYDALANDCAHGGIWMAGRAPAIDEQGNVYVLVGNGKNDLDPTIRRNFGNSLVKLDPQTLNVIDYFTPSNHIYLNDTDLDFGGSGPMIMPNSDFIIGGGKEGMMYVWNKSNLGHFTPNDLGAIQQFATGFVEPHIDRSVDHPGGPFDASDSTPHAGHIMGGPVFWPRTEAEGGARLYNWSENAELRAYAVDLTLSQPIREIPIARGIGFLLGHPGGILSLSANGGALQTGIVWANTYEFLPPSIDDLGLGYTSGALNVVRDGVLRAYDATTLTSLWNSETVSARDRLGKFAKFTPPTVAGGRVYMATFSETVAMYGLLGGPYSRPSDSDSDGVADAADNCPLLANADQLDANNDERGDACQDTDGDGALDSTDNCTWAPNANQENWDHDALGDACDDSDRDGLVDAMDNCRFKTNANQTDLDGDGSGDACDVDADDDGICFSGNGQIAIDAVGVPAGGCPLLRDNCPAVSNAGQNDSDKDGTGDACDSCLYDTNVGDQPDHDGIDSSCDTDDDNDGVEDKADNCPLTWNPDQFGGPAGGPGWACDPDRLSLRAGFERNQIEAVISLRDRELDRFRVGISPNFTGIVPPHLPTAPRVEVEVEVDGDFRIQIVSPDGKKIASVRSGKDAVVTFEPDPRFFGSRGNVHMFDVDSQSARGEYILEMLPGENLDRGRDYKVRVSAIILVDH